MTDIIQRDDGLILSKGTVQRPFDPNELKYAAVTHQAPITADLSQPVFVGVDDGRDLRVPIMFQGRQGACGAFGTIGGTLASWNWHANQRADVLHPGWLYEQARRRRNWFPQDTGSVPADCADLILDDAALLTTHPYVDNAAFAYPDYVGNDSTIRNYLGSHRPIYTVPGMVEAIWIALKQGFCIGVASYWPNAWNRPSKGKLPENAPWSPNDGGHYTYIWGYAPALGFLAANSWSPQYTPDASQTHRFLRPGDFVFPLSYFMPNGPLFDIRVLAYEPVEVPPSPPEPPPQPPLPPEPTPPQPLSAVPRIDKVVPSDRSARKWWVEGSGFTPSCALFVDSIRKERERPSSTRLTVKGLTRGMHKFQVKADGRMSNVLTQVI